MKPKDLNTMSDGHLIIEMLRAEASGKQRRWEQVRDEFARRHPEEADHA